MNAATTASCLLVAG
ncbi:hypothetical protein OYC64_022140, partial [Pagothenia borchgrevinki]